MDVVLENVYADQEQLDDQKDSNKIVKPSEATPIDLSVSVVIPTYNPPLKDMQRLFTKIREQIGVKSIEIVIVDSGSTNASLDYMSENADRFIAIPHATFTHSYARNTGALKASGDVVLFMTQDAMPSNKVWMYNLIGPIADGEAAAVSCREMPRGD